MKNGYKTWFYLGMLFFELITKNTVFRKSNCFLRGTTVEKCFIIIDDSNFFHGTILEIGISRISSAPQALSCGMSWFTRFFGTTVWML